MKVIDHIRQWISAIFYLFAGMFIALSVWAHPVMGLHALFTLKNRLDKEFEEAKYSEVK